MWVRGLKLNPIKLIHHVINVAPRVGAWIETQGNKTGLPNGGSHPVWVRGLKHNPKLSLSIVRKVAPRVGAWIETRKNKHAYTPRKVAPRVGAWIETLRRGKAFDQALSHPVWVRGLKQSKQRHGANVRGRTPCGCVD